MLRFIDTFLNKITMYRLVFLTLATFGLVALFLSFLSFLPFSPLAFLLSASVIFVACLATNYLCARFFGAPTNRESTYITALILIFLLDPALSGSAIALYVSASLIAITSKYLLAIGKKHLLNPAALGIALPTLFLGWSASWWIGSRAMLPLVLVGGFLIIRKLQRFDLVGSFLAAKLLILTVPILIQGGNPLPSLLSILTQSQLLFFAAVMLTEPMTTPATRQRRIYYGLLVAVLYAPWIHLGHWYSTPELALLVGNIFSYLISPKQKLLLTLREKIPIATDTYDFVFASDQKLVFSPGQYLEWTLAHPKRDDRGIRRYFTVASSPTEETIRVGVKFYPAGSSFKHTLEQLEPGAQIVASQLAGDFTLPPNQQQKLALIAGGIGITPFRSMIKYLVDREEKRPVVLLYSNKTPTEIAYQPLFSQAEKTIGLRTHYTVTDPLPLDSDWAGERGFFTKETIEQKIPDYRERLFYLSGPRSLITAFEKILKELGIPSHQIKTDFFPGFA